MKFAYTYDHHNGLAEWQRRELSEWLTDVFEAPRIKICDGCTTEIRNHVVAEIQKEGWATNVKIDQASELKIFAMREDLAIQLQTGNVSRAPYDLLKLQYLYNIGRIEAAALAIPTKESADKIGSNVVNAERLCNELDLFDRIVTIPILVIAFN